MQDGNTYGDFRRRGFRFGGASVFACESEKENKRMNHRNYQKELDTILEDFEKQEMCIRDRKSGIPKRGSSGLRAHV